MLESRFKNLCASLGTAQASLPLWDILAALYQVPPRSYHSLNHIADCLRVLDECPTPADDRPTLEFALWLHDCIYDSHAKDNEERSAAVAHVFAAALNLTPHRTQHILSLIMATKHTGQPLSGDHALIVDIDLAGFGLPWPQSAATLRSIREEFHWVPIPDFRASQIRFLTALAQRPAIYHHQWFKDRFEAQARCNIAQQLEEIPTGAFD